MLLKYFYDKRLAQASYLVGCVKTGEALVVDPARDITPYLRTAAEEGLRITHITETHIHADFVSGARELAAATGAKLYLSDMGDANWKYAFPHDVKLHDGDRWKVGNIEIEVIHTPGHTPEHIAFMFTDTAGANAPMGVFTGDFLFVGDVGRPDLLEVAAGFVGTKEAGARLQFRTIEKFKALPDYLQILPAHGAGSACGKALGAIPSTTLGYEKRFNPAFQFTDENQFVAWLLDGQPEPPRYFAQMKKVNKEGSALLAETITPSRLDREGLNAALQAGALVIDARDQAAFARAHVPGTLNIPHGSSFNTYAGWYADYDAPLYLVLADESAVPGLIEALRGIGVDNTPGYFVFADYDGPTNALPVITAQEAASRLPELVILDVRGETEYKELHVVGARHIPVGYLPRHLDSLPRNGGKQIAVHCASGFRSQIAVSLLQRAGFTNVLDLAEPEAVWSKALPVE